MGEHCRLGVSSGAAGELQIAHIVGIEACANTEQIVWRNNVTQGDQLVVSGKLWDLIAQGNDVC